MKDINEVLEGKYLLISVVGSHAGEGKEEIFSRKKREIQDAGRSFWLIKSHQAKPDDVQSLCKTAANEGEEVYCVFIEPAQEGGAEPTKHDSVASQFSEDKVYWQEIPEGIKITGNIKNASALVFGNLEVSDKKTEIDLWEYSNFRDKSNPIKFRQGASTVCAIGKYNEGMKSRYRKILGFGKLVEPFAIWLK